MFLGLTTPLGALGLAHEQVSFADCSLHRFVGIGINRRTSRRQHNAFEAGTGMRAASQSNPGFQAGFSGHEQARAARARFLVSLCLVVIVAVASVCTALAASGILEATGA